jgi:hypothetical protein
MPLQGKAVVAQRGGLEPIGVGLQEGLRLAESKILEALVTEDGASGVALPSGGIAGESRSGGARRRQARAHLTDEASA